MTPATAISMLLAFANTLKFKNLFFIVASLFVVDLLIPDFIPLIDEIFLGLLTVLLANWKKDRKTSEKQGNVIEGEVLDEHDQSK